MLKKQTSNAQRPTLNFQFRKNRTSANSALRARGRVLVRPRVYRDVNFRKHSCDVHHLFRFFSYKVAKLRPFTGRVSFSRWIRMAAREGLQSWMLDVERWAFACAIVRFPHALNHSRTFVRLHFQSSVVTLVDFVRYHGRAGGKIC